jgi:hypothetical protein
MLNVQDCRKSKAPDSKHKRKRSKCDQGDSSPTDSSPTESACTSRDAARDVELKPSPRSRSSCVPCNPKRSCPEGDTQKAGKSPRDSLDSAEDGGSGKKISKTERDGGASTLWDLVECQVCGSTQDEERMILCDVCDGGTRTGLPTFSAFAPLLKVFVGVGDCFFSMTTNLWMVRQYLPFPNL